MRTCNLKVERRFAAIEDGLAAVGKKPEDATLAEMDALWDLRKKSVGLLANIAGARRPVPFVEDTAVPPEHLPEFVAEFRSLFGDVQLRSD